MTWLIIGLIIIVALFVLKGIKKLVKTGVSLAILAGLAIYFFTNGGV